MKKQVIGWLLVGLLVASCFPTIDQTGSNEPVQNQACIEDANCDDQDQCTRNVCGENKTCEYHPVDGLAPEQKAGDCQQGFCNQGVFTQNPDDTDLPDDLESCTTDSCLNGVPIHEMLPDDTGCTFGDAAGLCKAGVCTVECGVQKPCNDGNPCTVDTCNVSIGSCTFIPIDGLPTPDFQDPVGDCRIHICMGGFDSAIVDESDVPDDANSCTFGTCKDGIPANPPVPMGIPCIVGQPFVCDGQGACVECNQPLDCVFFPVDDDCSQRTCINHVCGQTFTLAGTPISTQKQGDCKQFVCDGTGGTVVQTLDTDLPNDNNPCTKNICTNGTPSNPNEPVGFSCGNPLTCDGNGKCVGCNQSSDCVGVDDFCKTRTCINQSCGYIFTPAGTDLPAGQTAMDCKVIECDGQGNIVTSVDPTDVPVDGNQCTNDVCSTQGVPSNPYEPVNTACNQSGGTVCNGGGACKKANGNACAAAGDCLSGFCVDGVCCNAACTATCKSCNVTGQVGTCANVPNGSPDPTGSMPCQSQNGYQCDGMGVCKGVNSVPCTMATQCVSGYCVDGYCCGNICNQLCLACSGVLTGLANGSCKPILNGTDPRNECANGNCNGAGMCSP